jgi:hypothetical protein
MIRIESTGDPERIRGVVSFKTGFAGHVFGGVRDKFEELHHRPTDGGSDELGYLLRGCMPSPFGSDPALRNRNHGHRFEFQKGPKQCRSHPEKVIPEYRAAPLLPTADESAGGSCRNQNRITAFEALATQIKRNGVRTDGFLARRA